MRVSQFILALSLSLLVNAANAVVIDNSDAWTGDVSGEWHGAGQSFTVDTTENYLESIGFYFGEETTGNLFNLQLTDAANGGTLLYESSFSVTDGLTLIDINEFLSAGSTVYAHIIFNGLGTIQYNVDTYDGGHAMFLVETLYAFESVDYDLRFIANFTDGQSSGGNDPSTPVPAPMSLLLMAFGVLGLAFSKRRA
ncbi:MAG: hypothetical protein OEX00_09685 [Gammaproteobacteria bacterium]|nr:hypothetical protein [Gammaproteobacteria bacterium]MDH5692794.1 hypothetical protein [Gammaproteobacteria bacterium]